MLPLVGYFVVKDAEPKFISIVSWVSRDKDTRQTCLVTKTLTLPVYVLNFKFDDLSYIRNIYSFLELKFKAI